MYAALLALLLLVAAEGAVRLSGFLLRRDRAVPIHRTDVANVVYAIGDSFTYGHGVGPERAYPAILQSLIDRELGPGQVVVRNLGWPGLSSSNAVFAVARAIEAGDACLILVLAGWNVNDTDFQRHAEERSQPVPWSGRLAAGLERSRLYSLGKQLFTLRKRILDLDGIALVPQAPEMSLYEFGAYQEIARKNLGTIARIADENTLPLAFLNYPYKDLPENPYSKNEYYHVVFGRTPLSADDYLITDRQEDEIAIHSVIRNVGETSDLPVIDLHEAFERSGRDDLFLDDLHHPNVAGHRIVAETVFDAIEDRLAVVAAGDR